MCDPTRERYSLGSIEILRKGNWKIITSPPLTVLMRQLVYLMNAFRYKVGEDPDNTCILIPRYKALGRMSDTGVRYPHKAVAKPDESDLVPVRSIVTKGKDPFVLTTDCISDMKMKDLTDNTPIGISFATSLTESLTQKILGLKHGGHERVLDESGYLKAPIDCKVEEDGNWVYLVGRGKKLKYPRPQNLVLCGKDEYKKGDLVGTAYNTVSPTYKPNSLIKLIKANNGSAGTRYFEKDNVIISDCYAFNEGTISYQEDKKGRVSVIVGNDVYKYNPQCMYFYPEGTFIEKHQRICSGTVDMSYVSKYYKKDLANMYSIFRKQFYTLMDAGYVKTGITSHDEMQEELIEMMFIAMMKSDDSDGNSDTLDYLGTESGIMNNSSFYSILSYGYARRVVNRAMKGEVTIKSDVFTDTILGLMLNNNVDEEIEFNSKFRRKRK